MKILIVKLGAMGDVLRTTPLLKAFKKQYPKSEITWVVDAISAPVLDNNPLIHRVVIYGSPEIKVALSQTFDLAVNLDKENEALDTMEACLAGTKKGFGWDKDKKQVAALTPSSEYAVRLGIDDELKFKTNQKTYQEISFEQLDLEFAGEEYQLNLAPEHESYAKEHLSRLGLLTDSSTGIVGLNTGSGHRFAGKKLPKEHILRLAQILTERLKTRVVLLGGPEEAELNKAIEKEIKGFGVNLGTHHSILQFAALVSNCGLVITGDTIAMHIAIATKVPALVYFGSTCAKEIELYGRGQKMVSDIDCAPCYKRDCPIHEKCMSDMSLERIAEGAEALYG
jgi:ADP-heptose:LPS heptosyltransferase